MLKGGWKWLKMAGNDWNRPWFVPFQVLVQNMTGFDDDDNDSNGTAGIIFWTLSCQ